MTRFSAIRQLLLGPVLEQTGVSIYYYGLLVAVVFLLVLVSISRRARKIVNSGWTLGIAVATFALFSSATLLSADSSGVLLVALRCLCMGAGALAFVCLLRAWIKECAYLCNLDYRVLFIVLALSSMLTLTFSFGNYVSDLVADFKLAMSVPLSAICATFALRVMDREREQIPDSSSTAGIGARYILLVAVFFVFATVVRRTSDIDMEQVLVTRELMSNYFFTVLCGLACLLIAIFMADVRSAGLGFMLVCVLVLAVGYFILGFLGNAALIFGSSLITSARAWIEVLLFAACSLYARDERTSWLAVVLFAGAEIFASLLRRLVFPLAVWGLGISFDDFSMLNSPVLCFALLVFCVVVLGWASVVGRRKDEPVGVAATGESVVFADLLMRDHGLTAREAAIASYIARGYSSPAIARAESISNNTVTSHARSIYTKLGIHSRQELIELAGMYHDDPREV